MTHYGFYIIPLVPIDLNWKRPLPQPIVLRIPKKGDMEYWVYHLQGRAVRDIQLVSSWSYSL